MRSYVLAMAIVVVMVLMYVGFYFVWNHHLPPLRDDNGETPCTMPYERFANPCPRN